MSNYINLVTYLQTTYSAGYITMGLGLVALLRRLLVEATKTDSLDGDRRDSVPRDKFSMADPETASTPDPSIDASNKSLTSASTHVVHAEAPVLRTRRRMIQVIGILFSLQFYVSMGLGIAAGSIYAYLPSPTNLGGVQPLRYRFACLSL